MTDRHPANEIRGKTIRLTWTDGPTRGMTHEHVFHEDGTVEWRAVGGPQGGQPSNERPEYAAMKVADDVHVVSYLAASGYTLTVALNFRDHKMVGVASGAKEWYPVGGTFEVVE
jgi:MoaF N-terminal domain